MDYRNAKHIDATRIDCEINHPIHGWIPYTLDPADTDTTVDNDALLLAIGDDAVAYTPPTVEEIEVKLAFDVRRERNLLLQGVDVISGNPLRWGELTTTKQTEVATYRTALLDVPQQAGFPDTIEWPILEVSP